MMTLRNVSRIILQHFLRLIVSVLAKTKVLDVLE